MRILQLLRIGYVSFNGKILVNRDARLKKTKPTPALQKKPKAKKQKQTDNQSREKRYSSAQRVLIC